MKKFLLMFFAALGLFVFGNVEKADAQQQVKVFYVDRKTCQTGYDYAIVEKVSSYSDEITFRGEKGRVEGAWEIVYACPSVKFKNYIKYNHTAIAGRYALAFYYED